MKSFLESKEIPVHEDFNKNKRQFIGLHNNLLTMLPGASEYEFKLIINTITSGLGAFDEFEKPAISDEFQKIELVLLNQEIYQNNNIKDPSYYSSIIRASMNLFYCYKGVHCSVDSLIVVEYYFGFNYGFAFTLACESDLESFYLNYYLSSNQALEVVTLFNYLVSHYDK
jgi:hypothetical protein